MLQCTKLAHAGPSRCVFSLIDGRLARIPGMLRPDSLRSGARNATNQDITLEANYAERKNGDGFTIAISVFGLFSRLTVAGASANQKLLKRGLHCQQYLALLDLHFKLAASADIRRDGLAVFEADVPAV